MEHYITEIKIEELKHLSNISICLNERKRTNLLLTGKNGSGKTTVLKALKKYLKVIVDKNLEDLEKNWSNCVNIAKNDLEIATNERDKYTTLENMKYYLTLIKNYKDGIDIELNEKDGLEGLYQNGQFIMAYYSAERKIGIIRQNNVENVVLQSSYSLEDNPGNILLKYLVHLKTQQAYARNEGDMETVTMLDKWFERFVEALRILLDNESIQLKYDYKNYNFEMIEDGRKALGFDQLSDGYSAVIQIVADLILRMEQNWLKKGILSTYDVEGIVLIDELETHLHISLQKSILPFLTKFFPRIQFIVSMHSPYILNSIENCVIYDLEKNIRMEDMSGYSAEGIVEGYFEIDTYSEILLQKVKRYEELVNKQNPTEDERAERATLLMEMKQLSGDLSREAKNAFEEIEAIKK